MASFNYQAINTPGGIASGLAGLTGALMEAPGRRKQIEEQAAEKEFMREQSRAGLADRLARTQNEGRWHDDSVKRQSARDDAEVNWRRDSTIETSRHNQRMEEAATSKPAPGTSPIDEARIRAYDARAGYYTSKTGAPAPGPKGITPATYAMLSASADREAAVEEAARRRVLSAARAPNDFSVKVVPQAERAQILAEARARHGIAGSLNETLAAQNAPNGLGARLSAPPAAAPGNAAGLREHVTARFATAGQKPPAAVEAYLSAAEAGDPAALDALSKKYGTPAQKAPVAAPAPSPLVGGLEDTEDGDGPDGEGLQDDDTRNLLGR